MLRLQISPVKISTVSQPNDGFSPAADIHELLQWPALQNRVGLQHGCPQPVGTRQSRSSAATPLRAVNPTPEASINARLNAWLESAPATEKASRTIATERIRNAHLHQAPGLNLDNLKLSSLPDCLKSFSSLKTLQIRANRLTSLPALPPNLDALKAGSNRLTSLPDLPKNLRELSIYRNCLSRLPVLPQKLVRLHAYENSLVELPELPASLERLAVSENALNHCPSIHEALTLVNLSGNFLKNLPHQLLIQVNGLSNSAEILRQHQRQADTDIGAIEQRGAPDPFWAISA